MDSTIRQSISTSAPGREGQSVLKRMLARILRADMAYRQAQKLRNLPDERLADMGISRAQAESAGR